MINDRAQKQSALALSAANHWFPQLEVEVEPPRSVRQRAVVVTDLDVLASLPDPFKGFRSVVFDCKTKAKESAINRALWLRGVLDRLRAEQGFCVLRKDGVELDHRLMAMRLSVILLAEDEFDLYARATSPSFGKINASVANLDLWEQAFAIPERFAGLKPAVTFLRSTYWMIDDAAEACRKTLATIRGVYPEFDPAKREHVALFLDFCAIFARSLAIVVCEVFKAYLHPSRQADLSGALLVMLYGGREAYEHRNELYKLAKPALTENATADLSLPEWDRFLQLTRQLLDAPVEVQRAPLILRELGFWWLAGGGGDKAFAKSLCTESPQGARFASLIPDYLCRAGKLPLEFAKILDGMLLPLLAAR